MVCHVQACRNVVARAADRPLWNPGSESPAWLDGSLAGDYGFDPLGLGSDPEVLKYFVQAELVHARCAPSRATPFPCGPVALHLAVPLESLAEPRIITFNRHIRSTAPACLYLCAVSPCLAQLASSSLVSSPRSAS
jgi:hypothetical protein